jgi:hypothetical protein
MVQLFKYTFLILPFDRPLFPTFFLIFTAVLAVLFMFGILKRVVGVALFLCIFSLNLRNQFILDGSDNVIAVTLPFLVLSNSYKYFRFSNYIKDKPIKYLNLYNSVLVPIMGFAVIGFMIQISYVYFFTALHKLQGKSWLNGTAIYYTMRVQDFNATNWNIPLTKNYYFVVLGTYFTLFWELSFAFLVWFRETKFYVLVLGVVLHIGIWIFMRIDNFSWIMIGSYFVFITDNEYYNIKMRLKDLKSIPTRLKKYIPKKTNYNI